MKRFANLNLEQTSFNRDALQQYLHSFASKIVSGLHDVSFQVVVKESNKLGISVVVDGQPVKTVCQSSKPVMVRDLFNRCKLSLLAELEMMLMVPVSIK